MQKGKFFTLLIFMLATVVLFPRFSRAQNLALGDISEANFLKNIPDKINLDINGDIRTFSKSDITNWVHENTDLIFSPDYSSEIENPHFCIYKKSLVCELTFSFKNQDQIRKTSSLEIDHEAVVNFVKNLASSSDKDPIDARLKVENGVVSVFSLSSPGVKLDQDKSVGVLENYLTSQNYPATVKLPFQKIDPAITTDSIDNMGITDLIGEGKSNFAGSPKNRIHNIQVASANFNGVLIKPGEEFSFVKNLGEVDADHGYLPELVIKQNKTELDYGGGICQVSTTAFRAAIYSGLNITARTPHAYPVSYYNPQGMDATVYVPAPDLKFVNNTPGYILIETHIEGTQLFFDFYGQNDGRKTNIIGPTITERNPDGSMKAQFTQQVTDKNGDMFINDTIKSVYKSPSLYPHPGEIITEKPTDWSQKQWNAYKKEHNI